MPSAGYPHEAARERRLPGAPFGRREPQDRIRPVSA